MVMAPISGAFGGLLASAILSLDHFGSLKHWRMIFAIEGIITICIGLLMLLFVTDHPAKARWLTQEEKDLAISRLKSERLATTEVLDRLTRKRVLRAISSPVTIVVAIKFCLAGITVQGFSIFAPTIVKTIYPKASVVNQQLHTVPPYVVGSFLALLLPYISYRIQTRQIFYLMVAPCLIVGYALFVGTHITQPHIRYGALFLIAPAFSLGTFNNAQPPANVMSDSARNAAIGFANFLGNVGGLISTWSYIPSDAPEYRIGNSLNVGTSTAILLLAAGLWIFMKWDNGRRESRDVDAELAGLSQQQIQDLEWKHPGFRWKP